MFLQITQIYPIHPLRSFSLRTYLFIVFATLRTEIHPRFSVSIKVNLYEHKNHSLYIRKSHILSNTFKINFNPPHIRAKTYLYKMTVPTIQQTVIMSPPNTVPPLNNPAIKNASTVSNTIFLMLVTSKKILQIYIPI